MLQCSLKTKMHNLFLFFVWWSFQGVFFSFWQGKENSRLLRYAFPVKLLTLRYVMFICKGFCKPVAITASLFVLFVNHHRDQERYLLRIQELETAVARLGEESIDRATLLESVQSDKETISRSGGSLAQQKIANFSFLIGAVFFQTMVNKSSLKVKADLSSQVRALPTRLYIICVELSLTYMYLNTSFGSETV